VFRLAGPARSTFRDLQVSAGRGVGIRVEGADQAGGRVFTDQLKVQGSSDKEKGSVGVEVDGVEQSDVMLRCCQGGTYLQTWVEVAGGTLRRAGKPTPGQVSLLCGATGHADELYRVRGGGQLLARSVYHEFSGDEATALRLTDSGTLAVDAARFNYKMSATKPLVLLDGFRGTFALTASKLVPVSSKAAGMIQLRGKGPGMNVLCMNNLFLVFERGVTTKRVWRDETAPRANAAFLGCNMNAMPDLVPKGFAPLADQTAAGRDALIRQALAPLRKARLWVPADPAAAGRTDLQLHRVIILSMKGGKGVVLTAQHAGGSSGGAGR
jgi:hypothetical protein